MLHSISWQGYGLTLALVITFYYVFVFLLYYRRDVTQWVTAKYKAKVSKAATAPFLQSPEVGHQPALFSEELSPAVTQTVDAPNTPSAVQSLVDELQAFFDGTASTNVSKETILANLKSIVGKHPSVESTVYKNSVSQLIVFLAEHDCALHLSADEAAGIWLG